MFDKIAIIGVGLIGGSLGMAILDHGLAKTVVGVGRNVHSLAAARKRGAISHGTLDFQEGVSGADAVILATPVSIIIPTLAAIAPHLAPGTLVTDVGSTKETIVTQAETLIPSGSFFIGGHPMAGAETTGVRNADPYLFEGAFWILCPTPRTRAEAFNRLRDMVTAVGSRPITMSPAQHDLVIAAVSHLPHVVAAALVNTVGDMSDAKSALALAAGGFRDTTRIASSNPSLWRDILTSNRKQVHWLLRRFRRCIEEVENALRKEDDTWLEQWLASAQDIRRAVPGRVKGYLYDLYDIVVTIPDRPGSIANITAALAGEDLNICDLEILRVREGEAGTVRLAFASDVDRNRALNLLGHLGIFAHPK